MEKKIDVLMAVYNGERYIREQIESIMGQSYRNIHLTIRDNCSEDATRTIVNQMIQRYPGRISLILSKDNVGIIGNFDALLKKADAEYVMFSDSDDSWLPEKVSLTMQKMAELEKEQGSTTPLLVHTDLKVVDARLQLIHPSFWNYSNLKPEYAELLSRELAQNQVTGCTIMINRPLLRLACPIPQNCAMHDWWLALFASAFGKIGVISESTMLYRQHDKNDIGAKHYGLSLIFKHSFKKYKKRKQSFVQAEAFLSHCLNHCNGRLTPNQIDLIKNYIAFGKSSFFKRIYLLVKYQFYPVGFARMLWLLFR
jgi:glycosyltransferase involved in cell wall biosynthesis